MKYEEMQISYSIAGKFENTEGDFGLDNCELDRIAFLAEHPELTEPLFTGLQDKSIWR